MHTSAIKYLYTFLFAHTLKFKLCLNEFLAKLELTFFDFCTTIYLHVCFKAYKIHKISIRVEFCVHGKIADTC